MDFAAYIHEDALTNLIFNALFQTKHQIFKQMLLWGLNSATVKGQIGLSIAVTSVAEKIMTKSLALLPVSP